MMRLLNYYLAWWRWALHAPTTAEISRYFSAADYVVQTCPKWPR